MVRSCPIQESKTHAGATRHRAEGAEKATQEDDEEEEDADGVEVAWADQDEVHGWLVVGWLVVVGCCWLLVVVWLVVGCCVVGCWCCVGQTRRSCVEMAWSECHGCCFRLPSPSFAGFFFF